MVALGTTKAQRDTLAQSARVCLLALFLDFAAAPPPIPPRYCTNGAATTEVRPASILACGFEGSASACLNLPSLEAVAFWIAREEPTRVSPAQCHAGWLLSAHQNMMVSGEKVRAPSATPKTFRIAAEIEVGRAATSAAAARWCPSSLQTQPQTSSTIETRNAGLSSCTQDGWGLRGCISFPFPDIPSNPP